MLLCLTGAFGAQADEALEIHAYANPFPPYSFMDDQRMVGISADLLRAMCHREGLACRFIMQPWARAWRMALADPRAVTLTTTRTPGREGQMRWVGPITHRRMYFFALRSRGDLIPKSLDDLRRRRTGVVIEYASQESLAGLGFRPGENLEMVSSDRTNLRMLARGRLDYVVGLPLVLAHVLAEPAQADLGLTIDDLRPVWLLEDRYDYYFALNPGLGPAIQGRLQRSLEALRAQGILERLFRAYVGPSDMVPYVAD